MIHIVICDNKYNELEKIIKGERTILLRGSSSRRIPHSRIFINDELYFVEKGNNEAVYHAHVSNAESYSKLTSMEIYKIFDTYSDKLNLCDEEINKWKKKCLCIIEFDNLESIEPINIGNYTPLEDWIMVNDLSELKTR